MSRDGLGVLINKLGGSKEFNLSKYKGKTISRAYIVDEYDGSLHLEFRDGHHLVIRDRGRSCCEARYMTCEDNLEHYTGSVLVDIEVREGPNVEEAHDIHEQQFLVVATNQGAFTCVTHNEHNGYYGGFWMQAREIGKGEG